MTRETMKRRKETAGVIRKIDAHDMAKHEPTENAKKWMKRKAYSVEDCLKKWGIDAKGSVMGDDGSTHKANT